MKIINGLVVAGLSLMVISAYPAQALLGFMVLFGLSLVIDLFSSL